MINLSSAGAHNTDFGASAYQTAKFAACRLTEFMDQEYHDQGVIAIVIHPGGVKTELALNMPPDFHGYLTDTASLPADTLVWLVKERREWLAGRFISANWDVDELERKKNEIVERNALKFRMVL